LITIIILKAVWGSSENYL